MNSSPLDRVSLKNPVHLLALGFGSGLIRPARYMGKFSWNDFRLRIISLCRTKNLLNFDRTLLCAWLLSMSKNRR